MLNLGLISNSYNSLLKGHWWIPDALIPWLISVPIQSNISKVIANFHLSLVLT
jgi:hypothetical protein